MRFDAAKFDHASVGGGIFVSVCQPPLLASVRISIDLNCQAYVQTARSMSPHLPNSIQLNRRGDRVALVSMPFSHVEYPSAALGLLKAILLENGMPCDDFYFHVEFATFAGITEASFVFHQDRNFAGDYVFSGELTGPGKFETNYFERVRKSEMVAPDLIDEFEEIISRLRSVVVPQYLDKIIDEHDWGRYSLIGFTSTFQQQTATLAFAKRLKQRYPDVPIALGGANAWGEMGLAWLEYAPELDYVCLGEGDASLPRLITALQHGQSIASIPNLAFRRDGKVQQGPQQAVTNMDSLPIPNYDTYFEQIRKLGIDKHPDWQQRHAITFEASRGCWWGESRHCVFCGLNAATMNYRSKSPERVYDEITTLSRRHGVKSLYAVDNILDRRYIPTLFRRLDDDGSDVSLFFEIKSNMRLDEIRDMRRAGVTAVQPGIESLSTSLLRLMRKGVTGIQNVFLLKWCAYFHIEVEWTLLSGFYMENPEHYEEQIQWMNHLFHLQPPRGRSPIILERYSPLFDYPEQFGIENVRANAIYHCLYPNPNWDLNRIAYYFDCESEGRLPQEYFAHVDGTISRWYEALARDAMFSYSWLDEAGIILTDTRCNTTPEKYSIASPYAELFELAGLELSSAESIQANLEREFSRRLSIEAISNCLEVFVRQGWAINEGKRYLTLAVPESRRFFERPNWNEGQRRKGAAPALPLVLQIEHSPT